MLGKKLYKEQKHSIKNIEKVLCLGTGTLYNYANKKRDITKMQIEMVCKIADYEKIGVRELYRKMKEYLKND